MFRFDADVSHRISHFDSAFLHQFLSITKDGEVRVSVMHFAVGDHVGYHQALVPQLFAVMAGEAWVQDESKQDVAISAGQAAFWAAGEWHAARAESGMTAVVIEGAQVDPSPHMPDA